MIQIKTKTTIKTKTAIGGIPIITSNLVLYLDANNKLSTKGQQSILSWDTWLPNTSGGCVGYSQNGDGNSRDYYINPFGNLDIIWDSSDNDIASDADGGWNSSHFSVNTSKMYRFSTWVQRKNIGNGSFYLGTHGANSSFTNIGVYNRSNGSTNTNPYFKSSSWWGSSNQWYLVVGHVWPEGSGIGLSHIDSGIYDTTGTKITSCSDFVWKLDTTTSYHRSYLYYSTDPSTNQQWYQPRVDICDGNEPTITELLNDIGNKWLDISGNKNDCFFNNRPIFKSSYYTFNGISNYGTIINNNSLDFSNGQTLLIWMKHNYTSGRKNPWDQAYGGYGTWTHENGSYINQYFGDSGINASPYIGISSPTTPKNIWNCMSITRNIIEHKWFINGSLSKTTSHSYDTLTHTPSNIRIGSGYAGYWQGDISIIMAYNSGLTDIDITQLYDSLKNKF